MYQIKVLKVFLFVIFVLASVSYGFTIANYIAVMDGVMINNFSGFAIGFGVFCLFIILQKTIVDYKMEWLRVFSHEMTHVVFSILFFNKIKNFYAGDEYGGQVGFQGRSNFVISLTPYCFPLFTALFFIIRLIVKEEAQFTIDILIGLTYIFHLTTFLKQASFKQPDIKQHGIAFSFSFIIFLNIFIFSMITVTIAENIRDFWPFMQESANNIAVLITKIAGMQVSR